MKIINKVKNLKANGHYALAVVDEGRVYLSGQFSIDPNSGEKKFGTMQDELKQILNNIELILQEAGSCKEKVLKVNIYINDLDKWAVVDSIYSDFFQNHTPARTIATLSKLHFGFKVEVDVIASCK
ncbi:enamine deaminase RidA [Malaciobacter molluscorum]|uniref:RidA family protein n=1 Tax=Malaciobacter molluscorum TaxID=1032072 RepID=UPI00100B7BFE|nr:RidA family protein [Malaciobacter molluscorum]RXJ97270.1 enamine deaminase RidA [Malaciobacter molluscorum]